MRPLFLNLALFGCYTLSSSTALLLIKYYLGPARAAWLAQGRFDVAGLWVIGGAALYVLSFLLWMIILARNQLTVAYPIAIGLTLIASSVGSWLLLQEPITPQRLLGMAIILLGAFLVVRS